MIVVTGAAGFIGSCMIASLNEAGYFDLVLVDEFSSPEKAKNIYRKKFTHLLNRDYLMDWLDTHHQTVQFIIHLGARTDTTEKSREIFQILNFNYSCKLWNQCLKYGLPMIYASSAATYGNGANGYKDDETGLNNLVPLNPYGQSKNDFDKWVISQPHKLYFWAGFKFFNVYGPNEYHKGRMASVIFHAYNQIKETGRVKLFRSHRPEYPDGDQLRDFVYVKDVCKVICYFMESRKNSGLFNLGSGKARTFNSLVYNVFSALGLPEHIDFVETPADIRNNYQYFTEADLEKLRKAGYTQNFTSLENGIQDYVNNYLMPGLYM